MVFRKEKIDRLCGVIGVDNCDEKMYDQTYELTTDNCKKMLAVYMRFRLVFLFSFLFVFFVLIH